MEGKSEGALSLVLHDCQQGVEFVVLSREGQTAVFSEKSSRSLRVPIRRIV
jgi:hypothetical protein